MITQIAASNLVTSSNVDYLKVQILNMVKRFSSYEQLVLDIETAMGHFDYYSEYIETIVYSFVSERCNEKLNEFENELIKSGFKIKKTF